ncbi:MAG: PepSY-associated TM helix domain-containing protein [Nostoc sp. S4]|nr:PepSY-associated TM helix domain-containing protein [Nostoc sp. S4]
MSSKKLRNWIFPLHRYIGLAVGLIAIIAGLTGSLLVFHTEINNFDLQRQIGTITPVGKQLPVEVVLNNVKKTYGEQPEVTFQRITLPTKPNEPMTFALKTKSNDSTQIYVNPYTGVILGNNLQPSLLRKFFDIVYQLHFTLLVGDVGGVGFYLVGIVGLLVTILSITGILLWPGWRKLISSFQIKWNAHPKRFNFDVHKVVGLVTAVFLIFTFFTGFCWNFSDFVNPIIYAITFSKPQPNEINPNLMSVPIAGKLPLGLKDQLRTAQAVFPNGMLMKIDFPGQPEDALAFSFKLPQENEGYVSLEQYSGKVVQVDNSLNISLNTSLADRIFISFADLHYGTFWGLPSRIFYLFVGLTPLILLITGLVMWLYRYPCKTD